MTRYFLTQLDVEGFRGINNEGDPLRLIFPPDSVSSVFAPNAQGKSSIFEALTFAIRGSVPKLDQLPAREQPQDYYNNRFHAQRQATLFLRFDADDGTPPVEIRVRRFADGTRKADSPSGHPDPEGFVRSFDTPACLVDYRTFIRFVEDTPLRRGRSFSALLGIGQLSEMRQALEALAHARTLRSDFQLDRLEVEARAIRSRAATAEANLRRTFRSLTDHEPAEPLNLDLVSSEAAAALSQVALLKPFLVAGDIRTVNWEDVRQAIRDAEQADKQAALANLNHDIVTLDRLAAQPEDEQWLGALRMAVQARDAALQKTRGELFRALYEAALNVLQSPAWMNERACPVCERSQDTALAPLLEDRLREFQELSDRSDEIKALWNSAVWPDRLAKLANAEDLLADQRQPAAVAVVASRFSLGEASPVDLDQALHLYAYHERVRAAVLRTKKATLDALRAELPPSLVALTEQVGHAEGLRNAISECVGNYQILGSLVSELEVREPWCQFIESAASDFGRAEVSLSTKKTKDIETEYQTLYNEITNNPEIVPALEKSSGSEELQLLTLA